MQLASSTVCSSRYVYMYFNNRGGNGLCFKTIHSVKSESCHKVYYPHLSQIQYLNIDIYMFTGTE